MLWSDILSQQQGKELETTGLVLSFSFCIFLKFPNTKILEAIQRKPIFKLVSSREHCSVWSTLPGRSSHFPPFPSFTLRLHKGCVCLVGRSLGSAANVLFPICFAAWHRVGLGPMHCVLLHSWRGEVLPPTVFSDILWTAGAGIPCRRSLLPHLCGGRK